MEVSAAPIEHSCRLPQDGRTSHAYLHALIENNPLAVVVLDSNHSFKMCNAAFTRLFQYSPSELEWWGIDALIASPEFVEEAGKATHAVLAGEQVHLRSKRRRRDGLLIHVAIHGVPLLLDGCVEGVFGLYQDVTERTDSAWSMQEAIAQLQGAHDEELRRFALDLHDSLSQDLALLSRNLNCLQKLLPRNGGGADEVLQQTRELAALCGDQIRSVGRRFLQPVADTTLPPYAVPGSLRLPSRSPAMTEREVEITTLLATGLSSKEVALHLNIGTRTVETHRLNIYRKLRLRNIADLVLYAVRNGLLPVAEMTSSVS